MREARQKSPELPAATVDRIRKSVIPTFWAGVLGSVTGPCGSVPGVLFVIWRLGGGWHRPEQGAWL